MSIPLPVTPLGVEQRPARTLVGRRLPMSFAQDRTAELWRGFMPHRAEILHRAGPELLCVHAYPAGFFAHGPNPTTAFDKWAAAEVTAAAPVPEGLETYTLPAGAYAVFHYRGTPAGAAEAYRYIFQEWLPQAGYRADDRPHFQVLGAKYQNGSPNSEEELWIPVRPRP